MNDRHPSDTEAMILTLMLALKSIRLSNGAGPPGSSVPSQNLAIIPG
jgi:hypothetical protein